MTAWKTARIESFCTVGAGGTPSRDSMERYYEGGTIPWVKSGELRETIIHDTEEHITEAALRETNVKMVPAGALLLAMYGATVGRLGTLGVPATTNQAVCHIIPDPTVAEVRYLFHAMCNQVSQLVARSVGGAQPNISQSIVRDLAVPLPPLPEQRRITEILDKADGLRAKRRAALAQLNTLTQSIFVDMFGDPATNSKRWPMRTLNEIGAEFRYGTSVKSSASGKLALRIPNIIGGAIDLSDLKRVPVTDEEFERLRLRDGDLLFVRTNGNPDFVGRCALYDRRQVELLGHEADQFIYASYLIRARVPHDEVEPVFLRDYLLGAEGRRRLRERCKTSAGQYNINTEGLGAIPVPLPAYNLQREFAERVEAVERVCAIHRTTFSEIAALFASLQHRAFRGEL